MTKPPTAQKSKGQRNRKPYVNKMPPPPARTRLSSKNGGEADVTEKTVKKNNGDDNQQVQQTETEFTELTSDLFDCLKLENCQMKNMRDELESKVKLMEKAHAAELAELTKKVDALDQTNGLLKKQLSLSQDIVNRNERLKKENDDLKNKNQIFEENVAKLDKLNKKLAALEDEAECTKTKLEDFEALKANHSMLIEQLEIANQTVEHMKLDIITEKTYSAKEKRFYEESGDNYSYEEKLSSPDLHVDEQTNGARDMSQFPREPKNPPSRRYVPGERKERNDKPPLKLSNSRNESRHASVNWNRYPPFPNRYRQNNSRNSFYRKTHPYNNPNQKKY